MPTARRVSIPFIAGQWSLPVRIVAPRRRRQVSIPFIAGQWSLQGGRKGGNMSNTMFQSPSLRGSGRFDGAPQPGAAAPSSFNPLHCGAVVASLAAVRLALAWRCFNPLHCGAVVASGEAPRNVDEKTLVSIPFIAGQWSLRPPAGAPPGGAS